MSDEKKIIIYQVLTRLFGNNNNHCINNGDIVQNGCGKMADLEKSGNWVLPISGIQALLNMLHKQIIVGIISVRTTPLL